MPVIFGLWRNRIPLHQRHHIPVKIAVREHPRYAGRLRRPPALHIEVRSERQHRYAGSISAHQGHNRIPISPGIHVDQPEYRLRQVADALRKSVRLFREHNVVAKTDGLNVRRAGTVREFYLCESP